MGDLPSRGVVDRVYREVWIVVPPHESLAPGGSPIGAEGEAGPSTHLPERHEGVRVGPAGLGQEQCSVLQSHLVVAREVRAALPRQGSHQLVVGGLDDGLPAVRLNLAVNRLNWEKRSDGRCPPRRRVSVAAEAQYPADHHQPQPVLIDSPGEPLQPPGREGVGPHVAE